MPLRHWKAILGRRQLLLGGAAAWVGALAARKPSEAAAQRPSASDGLTFKQPAGPAGIEFLDYDPPRRWAAGARVGNIVYLAGATARDPATGQGVAGSIEEQTELVCQNIQRALKAYGTDFAHVFKLTVFLTNMDHLVPMARVRARYIPRPIPSTTVAVARLSEPYFLVEIDAMALVPGR